MIHRHQLCIARANCSLQHLIRGDMGGAQLADDFADASIASQLPSLAARLHPRAGLRPFLPKELPIPVQSYATSSLRAFWSGRRSAVAV
jgi:hypothetical protein